MPVVVEIVDPGVRESVFDQLFDYLVRIDERFSTYKPESEISRINRGELSLAEASDEMRDIFALSEETKQLTKGYFDIRRADGTYDPSGIVKGWAIYNAALLLQDLGCDNFFVDVGGDIQTSGKNAEGDEWRIGIRSPFKREEIVKVVYPRGQGVATSGTYIRGEHIFDPYTGAAVETNLASLTVIGPNIYEADRFATAAFAMGPQGIVFIEELPGFEGYAIDMQGTAVLTSGFDTYAKA